jgi:hypothetical protein
LAKLKNLLENFSDNEVKIWVKKDN